VHVLFLGRTAGVRRISGLEPQSFACLFARILPALRSIFPRGWTASMMRVPTWTNVSYVLFENVVAGIAFG